MTDNWKIDYDKRQYQLMADCLQLFETKKLSLGDLISRLKGLLEVIEITDIPWKEKVRNEWWKLEQVYADAIYKYEQKLVSSIEIVIQMPSNQTIIISAIQNIRLLINEKMPID